MPTVIRSDLPPGERLPAAIERAAYFVVTEALANVAKHSGARRCEVRCRREGRRLVVEVWDDGAGGATVEPGGGLAGLASRVAGVDGTFSVSSPPGGPTLVRAEIPVASWAPPTSGWVLPSPRTEVGQDREHATVVVLRVGQLELPEDVADVLLGRALGDAEQLGDPDVRPALGHRREDLALARGQGRQRVVGPVADHELGDDLGIERRPAAGDAAQRVHELADVADAVLEQVADAAGAGPPAAPSRTGARRTG